MVKNWQNHPRIKSYIHPEYPNDLQVLIHDGSSYVSNKHFELVWVTITGVSSDVFTGRLLNQPCQITQVRQGDTIYFILPESSEYPLFVTPKYLIERPNWHIYPCQKCGFDELFDAPSDLMQVVLSGTPQDTIIETFTTFCPICGGVQIVQRNST
jgi:predicted RNA-binding Zn-ribbon protein involved in translation (DUF1610 family)